MEEMPKYVCHKEVWALKIKSIELTTLIPEDENHGAIVVTQEYLDKHQPVIGGYYVVYKDGYKSFSPAEAFEDGYTRI